MTNKPLFSIIVPCPHIQPTIFDELIPALEKQSLSDFELLLVPDQQPSTPLPDFARLIIQPGRPAQKRDRAAKQARGQYLAFTDSDAYPHHDWLASAHRLLQDSSISAVAGPNLTPPQDNLLQQASGLVWSSWLGAGGAGTYRNHPQSPRIVHDYPTSNLTVKKDAFQQVDGFNTDFWPGEDTKLCLQLSQQQGPILYHPDIRVFHHRRPLFLPHLKQISRFGFQRGLFARLYPSTSARIGYFIPLLFLFYLLLLPLLLFYYQSTSLFLLPLLVYLILLLFTSLKNSLSQKNFLIFPLLLLAIPLTHLTYGLFFLRGLLSTHRH